MGHRIVIHSPGEKARTADLSNGIATLGRSSACDFPYPQDSALSRNHLIFDAAGDALAVRDAGSKNGTLVNLKRLEGSHRLAGGDRISAGHLLIEYSVTVEPAGPSVAFVEDDGFETGTGQMQYTSLEEVLKDGGEAREENPASSGTDARLSRALVTAVQELAGDHPLEELFALVLDLAIEMSGAARGALVTCDKFDLTVRVARGEGLEISRAVRARVLHDRASLLLRNLPLDREFGQRSSIVSQHVSNLMCVPLQTREHVLGLLYVDSFNLAEPFTNEQLGVLTVMANVAAIRIRQVRLGELEEAGRLYARDLAQAAAIQNSLLPSAPPGVDGFDVAGRSEQCMSVGGDYFDFPPYGANRTAFVIADAAGKGMPAALMISSLQAYVRVLAESGGMLGETISRLNRHVASRFPYDRFITLFAAVADPVTGDLVYCSAGHIAALVVRGDGGVERLTVGGMVLGVDPAAAYVEGVTRLDDGDVLAMYTDGCTGTMRAGGKEEFGVERLAELIQLHRARPAREIIACVMDSLGDWSNGEPFGDDVTMLVARRTK